MSNHIVKHGQLEDIARDLWNKAKARDIERISYDKSSKKIKATNAQTPALELEAELSNLASIDERTKFKQDVSVDDAGSVNNLHIGRLNGAHNLDRYSGCRSITSNSFVDRYVHHLLVLVDNTLNVNEQTNWKVWAIKKGNTKNDDVVFKAYHVDALISSTVQQCTIKNQNVKCAKIIIDDEFPDEVYFIVQCVGKKVQVITDIPTDHTDDVVNLSLEPPTTQNSHITWTGYNAPDNMLALFLVGRESISSLAEKLRNTQADSSKYVLQSETTATGGTGSANMVARLNGQGKLDKEMLPAIAINDYVTASAFTHDVLNRLEFQNGDVVVVTANGKTTRYLCVDKAGHQDNLTKAFVPLNDKDGIVFSVNGQTPGANGDVTVRAEHIKYTNGQNTTVKEELDKKVSNITLKADNKNLQITTADGQTQDVNLTEAFKATNIAYGKQIAGATKATVDDALVALNEEATKSVKKIHNGTPDNQGNINVVVNQGGTTGITMTFGSNGGRPVEIATYMTPEEVTAIKELFR